MNRVELVLNYIANNMDSVKIAYREMNGLTRVGQQVLNDAIASMDDEELDALAVQAGLDESYVPIVALAPVADEVSAPEGLETLTQENVNEKTGVKTTSSYHMLKLIGRSNGKQRNFRFQYGSSEISVQPTINVLALLRAKPERFAVGSLFPIKAGTNEDGEQNIEFKAEYGMYFGSVLVSADVNLMEIANQRTSGGACKSDFIKLEMADNPDLKYEDVEAIYDEDTKAKIKARVLAIPARSGFKLS